MSRRLDDDPRSFWRFGLTEKFSNAGETRRLHVSIGRTEPFIVNAIVFYKSSYETMLGDAYRLLPASLMEGPRIWYGQLSNERRRNHNEWIEHVGFIRGLMLYDRNWSGPSYELCNLPRMSVMVKNMPELPVWGLNNMMMTIFGMLQPGHPLILGVKDVTVNGEQHKYSPLHGGNMIIRFFNNAVAQYFIDCVNGVEVFHENFQIVKKLAPHLESKPGVGERGW